MAQIDVAESPLSSSEELCNLLLARVRDYAIFMISPEGTVMTWNTGAELMKGYTPSEIIGQSFARFYTPQDQQRNLPAELLDHAAAHGRVEDEGWRVRKDGTRFWADVVITALRDDHGRLRGFAKITRDLTERRTAEAAIGELSARLFQLQDEERQRLSAQLHDRTSPSLTAVLAGPHRVKDEVCVAGTSGHRIVVDAIARVEAASDVIRRVAHMLHPSRLEQGGLVEALRWYAEAVAGSIGVSVTLALPARPLRISKDGEIVLFRLVQECLSHLSAPGGGRHAAVRVAGNGQVLLEVTIHAALPPGLRESLAIGRGAFGAAFAGIRERLRQLGGTLKIAVGPEGSVVQATLPPG
ncbi:MAG: PAS domain-containing sensor histidine kinase [Gemmatimonadales bacterium]